MSPPIARLVADVTPHMGWLRRRPLHPGLNIQPLL